MEEERIVDLLAYVQYKDLAFVRLTWGKTEYAVIRGYDFKTQTWNYSIGYYNEYFEAKKKFESVFKGEK